MAHILIVEDNESIHHLIKKNLELAGYTCTSALNGKDVFPILEKNSIDLILLDIMIPHFDGFEVMEQLEEEIPVIFLTARGSVTDKVKGLGLGADDYIVKPFDMMELRARIASVLRRTKKVNNFFIFGDVKIDLESRQVRYKEDIVDFTPQEFLLIEALVQNRNIAMSREKLLEVAWGYDYFGETRTVDVTFTTFGKS